MSMQTFAGRKAFNAFRVAGFVKLALIALLGLAGTFCRADGSGTFADPFILDGGWGNTTVDNTGFFPEQSGIVIGGYGAVSPVWYQWTAPQDGDVELDTVGSTTLF